MRDPVRISPKEARDKTTAGSALLVCAYDGADKFKANHLEGAIALRDFRAGLAAMPNKQEIIFYCV